VPQHGNRIIGRSMATLASDRLESDMLLFREIIMMHRTSMRRYFASTWPRPARTGIHITMWRIVQ
jgi:hypothetical protein